MIAQWQQSNQLMTALLIVALKLLTGTHPKSADMMRVMFLISSHQRGGVLRPVCTPHQHLNDRGSSDRVFVNIQSNTMQGKSKYTWRVTVEGK
jgi:hypothetical protein